MTRNLGGTELKRLHRDWRRRNDRKMALMLDGVQNPFNLGSILRTAAAYSVDHLWLVGSPSPNDAKVQKTALGSQKFVTTTACETSAEALAAAHGAGYRVVGVELAEGAFVLDSVILPGASIGPRCVVARSIVGPLIRLPEGSVLVDAVMANPRLGDRPTEFRVSSGISLPESPKDAVPLWSR